MRLTVHHAEAAGWWPPDRGALGTRSRRGSGAGRRCPPHLAHLQLEDPPLLLHLLRDFRPADLRADHPVQPGVLLLLLLDFGSTGEKKQDRIRCLSTRGPDRATGQWSCHPVCETNAH